MCIRDRNNGSKYIKVADSVKWMQGYMKLQNMRYNNRFELFVDISREILQRETITFIFQPFIENAMYHGLEPKIGKGKISLRGWQEQNNMIFTIEAVSYTHLFTPTWLQTEVWSVRIRC